MIDVVSGEALAQFSRGLVAQRAGDGTTAMDAYRRAIDVDPRLAPAQFNLGLLYRDRGEFAAAARCFGVATDLRPNAAEGWLHLGVCREFLGELESASQCYRQAISLDSRSAAAHFNLGNVERKRDRRSAAIDSFEAARALAPDAPEVLLNLGNLLREVGESERAIATLRECRARQPDSHEAAWNLSLALLSGARLEEGWQMFEHRWAKIGISPERGLALPRWRGERLEGKRILVWREQGLGDEILFATCLPDLIDQGAQVVVALDSRLGGLLARSFPGIECIDEASIGLFPVDYHAPIGDLPRFLRRRRLDFVPRWTYLVPSRAAMVRWQQRLAEVGPGVRVGVSWRSGLRDRERGRHYAALQEWAPLFEVPGVQWINLQYDDCERELAESEAATGARVWRWPDLDLRDDLESVAGLIWNLDVVITAPTAVSSLSGAIGIETWQIDSGNDWTLLGEDRSPWLPAVQAFRRRRDDDWRSPIEAVKAALVSRCGVLGHSPKRECS